MTIDNEEELEKMCDTCRDKSKIEKCPSCGKEKEDIDNINPNFDMEKFNKLKKESID